MSTIPVIIDIFDQMDLDAKRETVIELLKRLEIEESKNRELFKDKYIEDEDIEDEDDGECDKDEDSMTETEPFDPVMFHVPSSVIHDKYGEGIADQIYDDKIYVDFISCGIVSFPFPKAFENGELMTTKTNHNKHRDEEEL